MAIKFLIPVFILSFYGLSFGQEENLALDTLAGDTLALPESLDTLQTITKAPTKTIKKRKRHKKTEKISGWISVENLYDNNILDYSKTDLKLLENNPPSPKFYIKQPDDLITSLENKFKFQSNFLKKKPTVLTLDFDLNFYAVNSVRNYQVYQIDIEQKLFAKNFLLLEQGFIPRYYLRHLWDHETTSYRMAKFKRRWTGLEWQIQNLSKFNFGIGYIYRFTNYNHDFDERDTKAHSFKGEVAYQISKQVQGKLSYAYTTRKASGKSDPDTLVADISNRSHLMGLDFDFQLRKLLGFPLLFSPGFEYEWQKYTSVKSSDEYHFHRKDNYIQFDSSFSYRLSKKLIWFVVYSYEDNQTNVASATDPTSYTTQKIKSRIKYLF